MNDRLLTFREDPTPGRLIPPDTVTVERDNVFDMLEAQFGYATAYHIMREIVLKNATEVKYNGITVTRTIVPV